MRRRRWWAVWLAECPEEGSLHFRATSETAAKKKARQSNFQTEDGDDPMELVARRVTSIEHRQWLSSDGDWTSEL